MSLVVTNFACHTVQNGESCYEDVIWAKTQGILSHPEWYPGLSSVSTFEQFQQQLFDKGICADVPCGCHTVVTGDACYEDVAWAKSQGIFSHPEWYPGLSASSTFEEFQQNLYEKGICAYMPCGGPSPVPPPPGPPSPGPTPLPSGTSIRVAKALGSRGYDKLRVSLIQKSGLMQTNATVESVVADDVAWEYAGQFRYKWPAYHLSSAIVDVEPGVPKSVSIGGVNIDLRLPRQDEGSVGLIIADPCIDNSQWCPFGQVYDVEHTLQAVINSLAEHDELDYWMNNGDLFYDQDGARTTQFFSGLGTKAQSVIHGVTMGNHDYWQGGDAGAAVASDNFGNGLMQWYAQDAMSAKADRNRPFDFSVDPGAMEVAHVSNFFWYNMIGNVAFIGFSGEAGWNDQDAYFQEACTWAQSQNPHLLVLLGHWNGVNHGCAIGMDTPGVYNKIKSMPGCSSLGSRIKFFEGHEHDNRVVMANTGFMVGSNGMLGPGNFGLPILDTRGNQEVLWYFKLGEGGRRISNWDAVLGCIRSSGLSACTHYADKWMQQSFMSGSSADNSTLI